MVNVLEFQELHVKRLACSIPNYTIYSDPVATDKALILDSEGKVVGRIVSNPQAPNVSYEGTVSGLDHNLTYRVDFETLWGGLEAACFEEERFITYMTDQYNVAADIHSALVDQFEVLIDSEFYPNPSDPHTAEQHLAHLRANNCFTIPGNAVWPSYKNYREAILTSNGQSIVGYHSIEPEQALSNGHVRIVTNSAAVGKTIYR